MGGLLACALGLLGSLELSPLKKSIKNTPRLDLIPVHV